LSQAVHIIFCVESGLLENQADLLTRSVGKFLAGQDYALYAYAPRPNYQPSEHTIQSLESAGVTVFKERLNQHFLDYPIANKLLACRHFEQTFPNLKNRMFLDTDTVFLNALAESYFEDKKRLFLRPVDNKGPGTEGVNDTNDEFWQKAFEMCQVPICEPSMWTTVRQKQIRNYFNAGLVWVNGIEGFFQQWYQDFMTIVDSKLRPFGYQSRDGDDFRCLDQVALAITASRYQEHLQVLPETFNYPIPFKPFMQNRQSHPQLDELVHVHYHKWFQHPDFLNHVTSEEEKNTEQYRWLRSCLPLKPEISESFKC
jgi:lipopolysaccharide biosynthesis glycosyltransferase